MSASVTELFTGGLVTVRHPALLNEGELQRADDCVYRIKDPAIWRAPGRTALNTAFSTVQDPQTHGIKGIAHLSFENTRSDQIIAYVGTTLYRAPFTGIAGTVASTLSFVEMSGPDRIAGTTVQSGSDEIFTATAVTVASCTAAAAVVTTSASLASIFPGMYVSGTGVTAGTKVLSIDSATQFTLDASATSSSVTLTFTPCPFLIDAIGTKVFTGTTTLTVTAVSSQQGATGHYNVCTLSAVPPSHAAVSYAFDWGCRQRLEDNGATDEILETLQYGAKYFAWFGRGDLRQIKWMKRKSVGTDGATSSTSPDDVLIFRPVGMSPVTTPPTLANITTIDGEACAWPATLSTGYYWFLITEIKDPQDKMNLDADEVEGAYLAANTEKNSKGDPVPIQISSLTGVGVRLTTPAVVNTGTDGRIATHWGVYMAGATSDNRTPPSMASFRRILVKQITNIAGGQTIDISENRYIQEQYPTVNKGGADGRPDMSNPTFLLGAFNGTYARSKSGSSTSGDEQYTGVSKLGFGTTFSTGSPWSARTITGISVQVRGAADPSGNAGRAAGYYIYFTDGTKICPPVYSDFGSKDLHINYHGGEMDTWGPSSAWATADLDGDFSVVIGKTGSGSNQRLRIDGILVRIHFTSTTINLFGKPYRVVTYRDQIGTTVNQPANLLPKECSTGAFFQGSFVQNDLGDETAIHFSLPGEPERFPGPYVMRFNTEKRKDITTCIRTLGQIMMVGMLNSIKRVNYLPRETSTDLSDGLCQEDSTVDHGISGPLAAVKFDMPQAGTMVFYVAMNGVWLTDGRQSNPANMDLDWANTVKLSALSSCVVRVYPKEQWVVLYYCPAGATHNKNTRALIFSYDPTHIKQGGFLPCTGPLTVSARSSCEVVYAGQQYLFTGHESDGKIYLEDYGVAQATGYQVHDADGTLQPAQISPIIRTRKFYPAGVEMNSYGERIYVLFTAYGSASVTATATPVSGSTTVTSTDAFTSVVAGMHVKGTGIDAGTIVLAKATSSSITISRAANSDAAVGTLTFDTGTLAITIRGSNINEAVAGLQTVYGTTLTGDLLSLHAPEAAQGFELQFEKVPLTFDSNHDSATWADLSTNMRLHQFTYVVVGEGREQNRSTVN